MTPELTSARLITKLGYGLMRHTELPAKAAVLDGEVVASNAGWQSEFRHAARATGQAGRVARCVSESTMRRMDELLNANGTPRLDLTPLIKMLERQVIEIRDGQMLLEAAEKHKIESVVSKRRDAPYRSGECSD